MKIPETLNFFNITNVAVWTSSHVESISHSKQRSNNEYLNKTLMKIPILHGLFDKFVTLKSD